MALTKEDIAEIKELIGEIITERHPEITNNNVRYELEIRERILRVEEGLKHQRELMQEGFNRMDKRFEQVDKRFESLIAEMNARFAQVDKRFEQVDKRFETMTARMDRFMIWSFATTLTVGGIVVAAIKYLP
ncbi:MAG: hypothetical protein DWB48_00270 [Nitrosomonas sp.]|nr:hypothetical protein [Nitrosomonas sp.]MDF0678441.1 hypothetical protein [Nitrosomonas sp.]MDL1864540.1 hypothetical protein [Betaproteobacteria bacterium PRO5]